MSYSANVVRLCFGDVERVTLGHQYDVFLGI